MKTKLYSEPVVVKRNKLSGLMVTPSKNNPEWGFMECEQDEDTWNGRTTFTNTRHALINGPVKTLKKIYDRNLNEKSKLSILPGIIVYIDCLENDIPQDLRDAYFFKDKSEEENIQSHLKTNGNKDEGGIELTVNGLRILRFRTWDPTGTLEDVLVQHDNTVEANIARATIRANRKTATPVISGVKPIAQVVTPVVDAVEEEEESEEA